MISVPSFYAFHEQLALAEVHKLSSFIQVCSYRAMATNTNQIIHFNINDNSYECAGHSEQLSSDVAFGAGKDVCGPPSHPRKPISKPISFSNCSLIIYSDGMMQSGAIYLTNKTKSITYALTTPVGPVSYVRKYRYKQNSWQLLET